LIGKDLDANAINEVINTTIQSIQMRFQKENQSYYTPEYPGIRLADRALLEHDQSRR